MKKKWIRRLYAILFWVLIVGCNRKPVEITSDNNTEMQLFHRGSLGSFPGEGGTYYVDLNGLLHFFDYDQEASVYVCNKPNCKHETWDPHRPEELQCNAALYGLSSGFVEMGKLYIFIPNQDMDQIQIVVSEPDRSEQRILTSIDASHISSYGVLSNKLYLTSNQFIYDTDEEGLIVETFQIASSVYCIDLETGKKAWERDLGKAYNGGLEIFCGDIENLYLQYSYFEQPFDGENFEEALHHAVIYRQPLEGEMMEQVLTDAAAPYHLFRGWVQNDQLICSGTNALRDASVTTGNYLLTFDLEEEKLVEEIELASFPFFVDGEIFYLEQGETDYTHVDLRTNQKEKLAGLELDDLWPMVRAGEDFYFAKQKKEESENWTFVFVRRNPFLRGEIEVIHP